LAIYRQIHISFWQDPDILDYTPEEKYFYLYLMTNSKTSQCGVYELPKKIAELETGYNRETVDKLLQRFTEYNKIIYVEETKEIMLLNWLKHNPINGPKIIACVKKELNGIKSPYLKEQFERACIRYRYSIDTLWQPYREEKEEEQEQEQEQEGEVSKIPYSEIIDYLNLKTGKNFSAKTDATIKYINGRFSEGKTLEDFKKVIDVKCSEWLGKKDRDGKPLDTYLRPNTLFSPTNFENYLNQCVSQKAPSREPVKLTIIETDYLNQ